MYIDTVFKTVYQCTGEDCLLGDEVTVRTV